MSTRSLPANQFVRRDRGRWRARRCRARGGSARIRKVGEQRFQGIDGNGETDPRALLRSVARNQCVHADHLATRVQAAPGVARVDGGVGLNRVLDGYASRLARRADGADDARGRGGRSSRRSCRWHRRSGRPRGRATATRRAGVRLAALICSRATSCPGSCRMILRRILVLVGERNLDLLRIRDDVIVREDLAVFAQDESRSLPLLRHHSVEQSKRESGGGHVDHGGEHPFIDGNVVLLHRREGRLRGSLGQRKVRRVFYVVEQTSGSGPRKLLLEVRYANAPTSTAIRMIRRNLMAILHFTGCA